MRSGLNRRTSKRFPTSLKFRLRSKTILRDNYPYKLFAVPMKDVVRIHASSGTTGKPTVVGYTRDDLDMWSEVVARLACAAGATPDDIAQISFGYTLFTGAFGLHYGLEKIGATIIPISGGNTDRQINVMQDFGTTLLVSTPSYALYLAEAAQKKGIDTKKLPLKIGMFGGEGHTEQMRAEIEKAWDMVATENYGLSEIIGPGTSGECIYKNGMHIAEDHFYCEIVDKETLEPVPIGEPGELVITSLSKQALPILEIPHERHNVADTREVRMRQDVDAYGENTGAYRRHAHHTWSERLPVADRRSAARGRRHRPALRDNRAQRRLYGQDRSARRARGR